MDDWLRISAWLLSERARNFSVHLAAVVTSHMNDSPEQQHCPSCKTVFFMPFAFPLFVFCYTMRNTFKRVFEVVCRRII